MNPFTHEKSLFINCTNAAIQNISILSETPTPTAHLRHQPTSCARWELCKIQEHLSKWAFAGLTLGFWHDEDESESCFHVCLNLLPPFCRWIANDRSSCPKNATFELSTNIMIEGECQGLTQDNSSARSLYSGITWRLTDEATYT